jgi:phosphoglycerate dehydrogenase-like enzyme
VTAAGFAAEAVAEYALCTTLLLLRRINRSIMNQSAKRWTQEPFIKQGLDLLSTRTVGVLGLGHNGCAVADIFKKVGCCVLGYDKRHIKVKSVDRMFYPAQLGEIMTQADILVICLPHTAETESLIGAEELCMLGKSGLIINVARAAIIDEQDLVDALRNNTIAGAALDVLEEEPLPRNNRLWSFPNVVITPHIAGNVNYFVDEIQRAFLNKLRRHAETH